MSKKKGLPLLTLNRNYVLTSTKGHAIAFVKGKPTHVPAALYQEALAIGAQPVDGSDLDLLGDDNTKTDPVDPAERNPLILEHIQKLVEKNSREDFTAAGTPTVDAVSKGVGFKVSAQEIAAMWQAYHDNKADESGE